MITNHLKIAYRSLKKQAFLTFLNTFGLAIGMASTLLISLYIYNELGFDSMFADADRIHRINSDIKFGGEAREFAVVPASMAEALKNDFSEVEQVTRFRTRGSALVRKSDSKNNIKELQTTYVDSTFFDMFGIKLLTGDSKTALTEPNTLVMTKTAAKKQFGDAEALGETLVLNNEEVYTVTGVIDDLPQNSFLRDYSLFEAMAGNPDAQVINWGSNNYQTFIKLIPSANVGAIQEPLQGFLGKYVIPGVQQFMPGITEEQFKAAGKHLIYSTIPLTDIHLHSNRVAEISANNDIQSIYILSFIALFLIVLASVNFMNLSTAHSLKRSKEVGIRKTLGSNRADLIRQFLVESGLISFLSMSLAFVFTLLALPYFNTLANKDISIPFTSPVFWAVLLCSVLILGLLSGSYPAFFMSRFIPVKVLKGGGENKVGGGKIRNFLVVVQFAISIFLIVGTLVVYQQLKYIQGKDLGFSKDQVMIINDVNAVDTKAISFKEQVRELGFVKNATLSSFFPTPSSRSDNIFSPENEAFTPDNALSMQAWGVDYDYLKTMGLKMVAGRDFNREVSNDSTSIILNEIAVAHMGMTPEEALGMRISPDLNNEDPQFFTIIGVVKNFHFDSLRKDIEGLSLHIGKQASSLAVKIEAGDFETAISGIEGIWNNVAPGQPFNYYFMEDSFNNTYQSERRLGKIFIIFSSLSIFIACLGLFGLATFNAQKRTKEIGIRKVLGATVGQISYRLTIDFLKLVAVAISISLPIGWFAMNKWLEDFSYKVEIGWWVFILAAFLAISVAILTVSYQSIKAAVVNPVKSLRTE